MFRAVLASGFLAWFGFAAPAQAQSQHYQPGFPLVYYHPVPDVSSGGIYGYGHYGHHGHGYGTRHTVWDENCRCATPYAYGHRPVRSRRSVMVEYGDGHTPAYIARRNHAYRPGYAYRPESIHPRAYEGRQGHAWRHRPAYGHHPHGYRHRAAAHADVYVENGLQRRPQRQWAQSHAEVDRPYGYAYRPRPQPRNTYSSAYREDAGSWRTRRDGIVTVHPRNPVARPVLRSDDALVTPGRSGAVVVTGPRHRHAPQANGPVNVVRPKPEGQRIRHVRPE
ncbi:MAG: hypothetical protein O9342_05665 [Beijerinckiaceae bacterium]|nr:hypothetical protein [Beijerinckiaceae bacterium]